MSRWESDTGGIRERGLSLPMLIIREMRTDDNGCLSCSKVIHSQLAGVTATHCMMLRRQTLSGSGAHRLMYVTLTLTIHRRLAGTSVCSDWKWTEEIKAQCLARGHQIDYWWTRTGGCGDWICSFKVVNTRQASCLTIGVQINISMRTHPRRSLKDIVLWSSLSIAEQWARCISSSATEQKWHVWPGEIYELLFSCGWELELLRK